MLLSVHKVTFEGVVINLFLLMSADICCGTGALGLCLAQVCFSVQYRSVSVGPYFKSAETVDIIDATIPVYPIKIFHTHFRLVVENRFQLKTRKIWSTKFISIISRKKLKPNSMNL